jgi:hypothetical protein
MRKNSFEGRMISLEVLDKALTRVERSKLAGLTTPWKIQEFLDELAYSTEDIYRCPLRVLRDTKAHCFDGALFAASALRRIGHPPLITELVPNDRDDVHLLALYKRDRHWGAVAKSNFSGLRFREPIHRSLRELALSYFEQYFNLAYEKTLRGYRLPLNLEIFDGPGWMVSDAPLDEIAQCLDRRRQIPLITERMSRGLAPVDERSYRSGLSGANDAGLYKPDPITRPAKRG